MTTLADLVDRLTAESLRAVPSLELMDADVEAAIDRMLELVHGVVLADERAMRRRYEVAAGARTVIPFRKEASA